MVMYDEMSEPGVQTLCGALDMARTLSTQMPKAVATKFGKMEGAEWWDNHEQLFEEAWKECGHCASLCTSLPHRYLAWTKETAP